MLNAVDLLALDCADAFGGLVLKTVLETSSRFGEHPVTDVII